MLAHTGHNLGDVLSPAANLLAKIPSLEALVVAILGPNLVDESIIHVDFLLVLALVPPLARIVSSEEECHIVFVGQCEEHLYQVDRWIDGVRISAKD